MEKFIPEMILEEVEKNKEYIGREAMAYLNKKEV